MAANPREQALSSGLIKPGTDRSPDLQQTIDLLEKLARDRYWGTVEVDFRAGRIEVIRKEETIKVNFNNFNSSPNTGVNNEQSNHTTK